MVEKRVYSVHHKGGMAERSKALVLKTSIPKGIGGSNPPPTAKKYIEYEIHRHRLRDKEYRGGCFRRQRNGGFSSGHRRRGARRHLQGRRAYQGEGRRRDSDGGVAQLLRRKK